MSDHHARDAGHGITPRRNKDIGKPKVMMNPPSLVIRPGKAFRVETRRPHGATATLRVRRWLLFG
jgi:hypothetical protein